MSYSEEMIAELKETAVWDFDSATAFATKYKIKPRSVVAKVGALGLVYKAREAVKGSSNAGTKREPRPVKADLVKAIEAKLGISAPSFEKMNMSDLTAVIAILSKEG
jgi:hypothetical protein